MEFALVAPLLLVLVLGVVSYGYMLSFRQALSQAAAEGARAAATSPFADPADKEASALGAINDALGVGAYSVTCAGVAASSPLRKDGQNVGTCEVVTQPCASEPLKQCVRVDLQYRYRDHPMIPNFPGVGLVLPERLSYQATARVS